MMTQMKNLHPWPYSWLQYPIKPLEVGVFFFQSGFKRGSGLDGVRMGKTFSIFLPGFKGNPSMFSWGLSGNRECVEPEGSNWRFSFRKSAVGWFKGNESCEFSSGG